MAASMVEDRENAPKLVLNGNDPQLDEKQAAMVRHFAGVFVSQDHGRTWKGMPGPLPETHAVPFSVVCDDVQARAKAVYVRSSDNWTQWRNPIRLSSDSAEEVRMPAMAASGAMVHVTWMERRGGRWQMWYRGSRDHGETWSEALPIGRRHVGSTLIDEDGFGAPSDDDQSSITDDGAGTILAVWTVWGPAPDGPARIWLATIKWQNDDIPADE